MFWRRQRRQKETAESQRPLYTGPPLNGTNCWYDPPKCGEYREWDGKRFNCPGIREHSDPHVFGMEYEKLRDRFGKTEAGRSGLCPKNKECVQDFGHPDPCSPPTYRPLSERYAAAMGCGEYRIWEGKRFKCDLPFPNLPPHTHSFGKEYEELKAKHGGDHGLCPRPGCYQDFGHSGMCDVTHPGDPDWPTWMSRRTTY